MKPRFVPSTNLTGLFLSMAIAIPSLVRTARAGTIDWDGDNGVGNFSYNNNWYGGGNPADNPINWGGFVFSNDLHFHYNNGAATSLNYDYGSWQNIGNIYFDSSWTSTLTWNGTGNGLNFNQKLENNSTGATITIGTMNLSGGKNGAGQIELNPVSGDLVLNGNLYNDNSLGYHVYGNTGHSLTVGTTLGVGSTAANVSFTNENNNNVIFKANQTFAGGLMVKGGTVTGDVNGGNLTGVFGAGSITVGDATLGANAALTAAGYAVYTNSITIAAGAGTRTISTSSNNSGQSPTFSSGVTMNNNLVLSTSSAGGLRMTGILNDGAGTYGLTVDSAGSGDVRLHSANTFDGGVTIKRGSVELDSSASALGTGTLTLGNTSGSSNATLRTSGGMTVTNAISVASGNSGTSTIRNDSTTGATFSGGVALNNNLTLQANNTGGLTVGAITGGTGTNTITNAGTGAGGLTLGSAFGNGSGTVAVIQNSAGSGLTMNNANSFSGGLTVLSGTAQTNNNNGFGAAGNTINLGSTGNSASATLLFTSAPGGIAQTVVVATGGTRTITSNTSVSSGNGAVWDAAQGIALNGDLHVAQTGANAGNLQFRNVISGSGNLINDYSGTTGFVEIRGNNTWTGNLQILGNTRISNNADAIHSYNDVYVASTGILDWRIGATIGGLGDVSGAGGIVQANSGTSQTLTIGGTNGATYTFSGLLTNGAAASSVLALTKTGNITQVLSGNNDYSGLTTVSGGTLKLGHANALGSTAGTTSVSSGATLDLNGQTIGETISVTGSGVGGNGALINSNTGAAATLTTDISNPGAVTMGGSGNLNLQRILSTGTVFTLTKAGSGTLTTSGAGHNNLLTLNLNEGKVVFANTSGYGADRGVTINGGILQLSGSNGNLINDNQPFTMNGGSFDLNGKGETVASIGGTGGTITSSLAAGSSTLYVGGGAGGTSSASFAGVIQNGAGTMNLTKEGSGTQTLTGTNTYTGLTAISAGTLALGSTGSIDNTSGIALGTGGTLDVSAKTGGYTVGNLSGSGTVVGSLTVSTRLAIGNSPGTSYFNNLTLGASSTFLYELTGGGNTADLGIVAGDLTITAGSILDLMQLGSYTSNNKFTLFGYTGTFSGTFHDATNAVLADGATFTDAGGVWTIDYNDTTAGLNGGTGTKFVTVTAIPEPAAALLGGLGMLVLLRRRRRN